MKNNKNLPTCIKDIPVDIQVAKELETLSEDIQNGKYEFERTLKKIDRPFHIDLKRHFGMFLSGESVENACKDIYSNLSGYIKACGQSIQKTNENLGRSLDLIKLLAIVEKDLYEQIDDQIVRSNEFNEAFLEWCKQQGINDDEVRGLLETSFNRAYTLRDRIYKLRDESRNAITELGKRVGELETMARSFDNIIEEKRRELGNIYKEKYDDFIKLVDDKKRIIDDSYNKYCQTIDKEKQECQRRLENAKNSISEIDNRIRLFKEKEQDIKQKLQSFAEDKQKELDKIKTDTKDDLNNFLTQEKNNLTKICRENENEIKRIIEECENKLEQERAVLMKSFNKKIVYAIFASVALSSLIFYLFTTL